MGTNKGISSFNLRNHSFSNYFTADGLPGNDMTGWSTCSKFNKDFSFGGFSGGVTFRPSELRDALWNPIIVLTDFRIAGHEAKAGPHEYFPKTIAQAASITLKHTMANFSLEFSALSYFNPNETRYRYKLTGLDRNWNEVGSNQRVVTYSSLPSGTFHFLVQAASKRGQWSASGVDLTVTVLPTWWNTWWFRLIYSTAIMLAAALIYRYKLLQLEQQYNMRLEERIGERTRIAREIHDTLLQGFHGLILRFQIVANAIPQQQKSRQMMEDTLNRADQIMEEGRLRIRNLRDETGIQFPESLISEAEALGKGSSIECRVAVCGAPRKLFPVIGEEMYLIGREAFVNSLIHSEGYKIDISISFDAEGVCMRICDDGRGIPNDVLEAGERLGHWGLRGMRERSDKIGGVLKVHARDGFGTEVELLVPSRFAFEPRAKIGSRRKLRIFSQPKG
jgi:signal transduction histidine kinase